MIRNQFNLVSNEGQCWRRQRGQTIALVAISMVSLLAMVAVAIDLTTLYVAKAEIQRAADTVALAGAKAFVDSGVTTYPLNGNLQTISQNMGNAYVAAALKQNNVEGSSPQLLGAATYNFSVQGNPQVSVTLQKTDLPLFFARIWGSSLASVSASAIAEAYNPAYSQSGLPVAPKCVKPFLLPNSDPSQPKNPPFVDPQKGVVNTSPGVLPFIGEQIPLTPACASPGPGCTVTSNPAPGSYLPMSTGVHQYCPAFGNPLLAPGCFQGGISDFERSTECCDGAAFNFQQCGASGSIATWDPSVYPGGPTGPTQEGLQCLIHTTTNGPPGQFPQQDTLFVPAGYGSGTTPMQITPGTSSHNRYGLSGGSPVATSDSIITVPLFDTNNFQPASQQVTIVGFLQLFVDYVGGTTASGAPADATAHILNVVGCGSGTASSPVVSGGGVSAIPVRLIHN